MTASNIATIAVRQPTMTSLDLVVIINEVRKANNKAPIQHKNLIQKIETHPSIRSAEFSAQYIDSTGRTLKLYNLPKRECDLLVMSESLAIQGQVYDRLTQELGERLTRTLTNDEIKRIERKYHEDCLHHSSYELGETLKSAIATQEHSMAFEVDKMLEKKDFSDAARVTGMPEACLRQKVAADTVATLLLMHIERGEHEHADPVRNAVQLGTLMVRSDQAKKNMLEYQAAIRKQPLTLADIDREDRKQGIPTPRAKSARKHKV